MNRHEHLSAQAWTPRVDGPTACASSRKSALSERRPSTSAFSHRTATRMSVVTMASIPARLGTDLDVSSFTLATAFSGLPVTLAQRRVFHRRCQAVAMDIGRHVCLDVISVASLPGIIGAEYNDAALRMRPRCNPCQALSPRLRKSYRLGGFQKYSKLYTRFYYLMSNLCG